MTRRGLGLADIIIINLCNKLTFVRKLKVINLPVRFSLSSLSAVTRFHPETCATTINDLATRKLNSSLRQQSKVKRPNRTSVQLLNKRDTAFCIIKTTLKVFSKTKIEVLEFDVRKFEESFIRSVHKLLELLIRRTNFVLLDSVFFHNFCDYCRMKTTNLCLTFGQRFVTREENKVQYL